MGVVFVFVVCGDDDDDGIVFDVVDGVDVVLGSDVGSMIDVGLMIGAALLPNMASAMIGSTGGSLEVMGARFDVPAGALGIFVMIMLRWGGNFHPAVTIPGTNKSAWFDLEF